MKLSRTAAYALRATLHLAENTDRPLTAAEMANALNVPANYLSKILHALASARILQSARGPGGGFRLLVPADELTLAQVTAPFDDGVSTRECLLGRSECRDDRPCPAHEAWREVYDQVNDFFRRTRVADLMRPADP